ncbi:Txe/YoeB family addiction module toxin [Streptococcus moroccensis]|uniref:Endoribonuclease YoeB n=1 Tax=Streptococcus moroccensis TaxID=1451356 RepID=A0ABT9YTZ4_9STRE|nr:Txe/YoeB family addiction module toxin [Streptococcus moroccensis]MDQ0223230.1 Txe/YoeB family toxin of toxin-antitoxin system [Streptococcus moroccensis]
MYTIHLSKRAKADMKQLRAAKLEGKLNRLLAVIEQDPYASNPAVEKLEPNLYARRLSQKHRLVYLVNDALKAILVVSVWSHYDFYHGQSFDW